MSLQYHNYGGREGECERGGRQGMGEGEVERGEEEKGEEKEKDHIHKPYGVVSETNQESHKSPKLEQLKWQSVVELANNLNIKYVLMRTRCAK